MIPVAASLAGDVTKYGVDAGIDYIQGNEVDSFDVAGSLHNAGFGLVWSNLPGRFLFEPLEMIVKKSGGKFEIESVLLA